MVKNRVMSDSAVEVGEDSRWPSIFLSFKLELWLQDITDICWRSIAGGHAGSRSCAANPQH